jgi:hypothetical protein
MREKKVDMIMKMKFGINKYSEVFIELVQLIEDWQRL